MDNDAKLEALQGYLAERRPETLRELADAELAAHLTSKYSEILSDLIADLETRKEALEHELTQKKQILQSFSQQTPVLSVHPAAQWLDVLSSKYLTQKMGLGSQKECSDLFKQLLVLAADHEWLSVSSSPLIDFLVSNGIVEHKFDNGLMIRMW